MISLPEEIWNYIYEFDPTFRELFQPVLKQIKILTTIRLASDYFEGPSQIWPTYFRFFRYNVWYTATYTEESHDLFKIILYNEKTGSFYRHLHRLSSQ